MDNLVQRMFESQLIEAKANGSRLPSVTSVAAGAGISRSSMYRYHSAVVARIQAPTRCRENDKREQLRLKVQLLGKQLTAERMLTRALARACAELAAEKAAMKDQFHDDKLSLQLRVEQLEHQIQGKKPLRLLRAR
jgi:hypothetical protein